MRVAVVGTGYVGLVTAVGLAELGHTVVCIDVDEGKVAALDRGEPPIFERGLEPLLRRNLGRRLRATTDLRAAVRDSELTFICVGTPPPGPTAASTCPSCGRPPRQIGDAPAGRPGSGMPWW